MLKITMMLGSFERLLGEANIAKSIDVAKIIDEAGLYGIATGEHISLSSSLEGYPYAGGLRYGDAGRKPYLEPVALQGAFAAVTNSVKLSNCILLAPLRPAVLLAKQLATLDVLSNGRLQPVFGVGWSRDEYSSLNVDFSKRRQILRDNIAACRALWDEQPTTFESETVSFEGLYSMPQPLQKRIPILLAMKANQKNAAMAAELCDGWETGPDDSKSIDRLREGVQVYREAFAHSGRYPGSLIVKSHLFAQLSKHGELDWGRTFENVPEMLDAGVTEFAVAMPLGMKAPLSLAEITSFMEGLATTAHQY